MLNILFPDTFNIVFGGWRLNKKQRLQRQRVLFIWHHREGSGLGEACGGVGSG